MLQAVRAKIPNVQRGRAGPTARPQLDGARRWAVRCARRRKSARNGRLACQWARDEKNARARLFRGPSPGRLGEARVSDPTLGIDATPVCLRARSRPAVAGAIVLGLAALLLAIAPGRAAAQGADSFRKFLEALWPDAQAMGVSRATFDSAFKGVEPDMSLPDLVLPGKTESDVKGQAEFTKTPAQYVSASYLAKLGQQGKTLGETARHVARQDRERARRAAAIRAGHLGARDRVRGASLAPLRRQGARHPGLARPPQGHVPQRAAACAQDAPGRGAHARDHERLVGGRHGPHPVHAVGVLHAGLRPRRRRPQGHLGLGAGRAGLRGQSAARQGLGVRTRPGATRCGCPRTSPA